MSDLGAKPNPLTREPVTMIEGAVQKIIPPIATGQPELAEITFPQAEPLYQEIRIANVFTDGNGQTVTLKTGNRVRVTIEVIP